MARKSVKTRSVGNLSRRQLLQAAALSALGVPLVQGEELSLAPLDPPPWWLLEYPKQSRVVDAHAPGVVHGAGVDGMRLRDLLGRVVRELTISRSTEQGWRKILGDAKRIVLKFNQVGRDTIGTADGYARQITRQLAEAGYDIKQIMLVETGDYLRYELGTMPPPSGWDGSFTIAGQPEQFARYLLECDAIINIGALKTHQIAGMSGCLKNISHAVVRHPARYHAHNCAPYVSEIFGHPEVARRVRLNLLDALRMVVRNGPDARPQDIANYGGLLAGFDPLSVDQVGLSILALERRRQKLSGFVSVPALEFAARRRLGRAHPADIQRLAFEVS